MPVVFLPNKSRNATNHVASGTESLDHVTVYARDERITSSVGQMGSLKKDQRRAGAS